MAGVLSNKKKIRGWRRRVKQIEHWKNRRHKQPQRILWGLLSIEGRLPIPRSYDII